MDRRSFISLPAFLAAPPQTPQLAEKIQAFGLTWQVISAADWKLDGETLALATARPQQANPRRPIQFALAETEPLDRFSIEVDVRRAAPKGSLIIVYAWRKDGYFNYLHLSDDAPAKVEVHNGIFHCFGGDRVRISPTDGPGSLIADGWHKVKFTFDGRQGLAQAWVDGQTTPALKAIDLSLTSGRIGIGSFFNTADFRSFHLAK